ncbi:hypothetical protein MLD38_004658 [Melastoma candidum]|uniref:Uncharacterized protein n=1 Tax=Melastoma candidum TaxID=119954 RepID=A0ACB9S9P4_9MYRT|nr:hypothetical protein MLD38_004658 [Melastoma candidum]
MDMTLEVFQQKEEDVLELRRDDETAKDRTIQMDISDEDIDRILDLRDLVVGPQPDDAEKSGDRPISQVPSKGPGWEVVYNISGGVLSTLNS